MTQNTSYGDCALGRGPDALPHHERRLDAEIADG